MKIYITILLSALFVNAVNAQVLQLPFLEDFEETISNDGSFANWTTENLEGWQYWHIFIGQCMRFENNDLDQNDWLITKKIDCTGTDSLKVSFSYLYSANKVPPRFCYTNQYNGDASQSTWTELNFSFEENKDQWYSSEEYIIENPGDAIYFAFQYQVAANAGAYFLLDNFKVLKYITPSSYKKVGETEHFEFYTNISSEEDYHLTIQDNLEEQFDKLSSLWDRTGIEDVFSESEKIKVYYSEKNSINLVSEETPGWKCGFHNADNLELYLSPLTNSNQLDYYGSLSGLAINEFSQLAVSKRLLRDNWNHMPPYFLEGFGLYETGFRPRRDSIIKFLDENPEPSFNFVRDTSGIINTLKKDIIVSCIEGQLLTGGSYLGIGPVYSSWVQDQLPKFLNYFYTEPEDQRIKLQVSTTDFDFYGATSDSSHFSEVVSYFEKAYAFYIENYNFKPKHRFRIVIVPTEPIGMDILNYHDYFNGGVGCGGDLVIQLSPNYNYNEDNYYSKYFGYEGMCAHEFFHIYYNHFMWEIPGGFWAEGTADFSQRHSLNWSIPQHSIWNINALFTDYKDKYNVDINLEHISSNPNGELDIYFLGDMFFEFVNQNYGGYENIRKFFNQEMDYSVFGATYEEIDHGYTNFLKSLAGIETSINDLNLKPKKLWVVDDKIKLDFIQPESAIFELYDITGRKLITKEIVQGMNEILIPNSDLSKIFIAKIISGNQNFTQKIIRK